MADLSEILQEMAFQMEGVIALSVVGAGGLTLFEHNPRGVDMDAFSVRFATVMNMVEESIDELQEWGKFKDNLILVQTSNAWILTRWLKSRYFLCIALTHDGNLRDLRQVAQKYTSELRDAL